MIGQGDRELVPQVDGALRPRTLQAVRCCLKERLAARRPHAAQAGDAGHPRRAGAVDVTLSDVAAREPATLVEGSSLVGVVEVARVRSSAQEGLPALEEPA